MLHAIPPSHTMHLFYSKAPSKRLPFPVDVDTRVDTPEIEARIQF